MKLSRVLFLVAFFLVVNYVEAQNQVVVKQSKVIQNIGGKDFYMHLVEQGQTLYSIAKAYNIDIESIRQTNNILNDKVITGQKIKIPVVVENGSAENGKANSGINHQGFDKQTKNCFEYQARSKESLYQIALTYRVSIDEIYAINPGISDQLKTEQIIKIPLDKSNENFITHKVRMPQSINRLAKDYKISVESIREINPYIARNLEPGQVVKIPLSLVDKNEVPYSDTLTNVEVEHHQQPSGPTSGKEFCHHLMEKGELHVALLLPFYFSEIDSLRKLVSTAATPETNAPNPKSFNFIQFYEGFMMALDSLKKVGLNVKVYVFNVEDNVSSAEQVINRPELKKMDMIIGPVHARSFAVVAEFARKNEIFIVNPFSTRDEIISDNPFVFKVQPSTRFQFPVLVSYLNQNYRSAQIFIAHNSTTQDREQLELLKAELKRNLAVREFPLTDLFTEMVYARDTLNTFMQKASENRENVIVVFSDNKAFLLDFMRKANDLKDDFPITIIGMPNWRRIDGLDATHLSNLNTRIFAEDNVDYRSVVVKNFVIQFREYYITEPQKYAFQGYDVGIYFLSALMKYGRHFSECVSFFDMDLMNSGYDFENEQGQGFENTYWKILRFTENGLKDDSMKLPTYDFSVPPAKYYHYKD